MAKEEIVPSSGRALWRGAAVSLTFLALLSPSRAHAGCLAPEAAIRWSYPNESTPPIPPDAVFWAVSHIGAVSVEVDGVALTSRGDGKVERHQFTAAAPLTEGEHELVIRVASTIEGIDGGSEESSDERRVRFRVAAQPRLEASVSVESVRVYPLMWSTAGQLLNPPEDEYDFECGALSTWLEYSCNDLLPEHIARVGYVAEGQPVAYLVQGETLVPPGCASFWMAGHPESDPALFRAAAVLPTGVADEIAFAGPVEVRSLQTTLPGRFGKPDACSLRLGPPAPSGLGAVGLALAAWCARRRRR